MQDLILVCDGSAIGNPGPGGFAAILKAWAKELVLTGGHPATTNNPMELMAAIEGLRALKMRWRIELISDSQYVKNGITQWLPRWQENGWVSSSGKPVLNQDLWHQLEQLIQQHEAHWSWTPGHAEGDTDQNRVDQLARRAVAKLVAITDGAEIARWVQFRAGLLIFVVVPGDPESGAFCVLDRKSGTWYWVDFDDQKYGGYSEADFECLMEVGRFARLIEQPQLLSLCR